MTDHNMSWAQQRIFLHGMLSQSFPTVAGNTDQPFPWQDIPQRYRERATFFLGFETLYAELGSFPAELRMSIEPLHPLPPEDLQQFVADQVANMSNVVVPPGTTNGLSALSMELVNAYNPAAQILSLLKVPSGTSDLLLFDPLLGFAIWKEEGRIRNGWLGNMRDVVEIEQASPDLKSILLQKPSDHFSIGRSLLMRLVGPFLPTQLLLNFDSAGIPTIHVATQKELQALVEELRIACARCPADVSVWLRGQTSEYLLPDRGPLIHTGICPYADIRDHSLLPSLYRHYDDYLESQETFHRLAFELTEWSLWSDLCFGDPADYRTLDGDPYKPKSAPPDALATMSLSFSGDAAGGRAFSDMGPTTHWRITTSDGELIDENVKHCRPGHETARRNLVLQHYGAPTALVDVTRDVRVAAWFATNQLTVGQDGLSDAGELTNLDGAVIYVFLALDGLTPVIETGQLVRPDEALRPHRQACGVLGGAGNLYRNSISRFIALKIKLSKDFKPHHEFDADYLFPSEKEDPALSALLRFSRYERSTERLFPVYLLRT